ncbi:transcriptional regulator, AsnC family [Pseudomonas sp. NFACC15-1]|uniref:Lrp/AsnC family transcriptional regulator n=1 Tax=unclassified Pseudomonas TaxID=196821 RepID=UPI000871783A|nr:MULTISPECIES: Lrp/AsnC family transcriptional regulator [unclassified Pseudomonas]SCW83280.1 transcriptional regulator, AsnC family [Pseudomonas sp. NFACC05-1]SCW99037.1 transcriptional regulator, AsnC family [Pseudomonas sp. NFACC56-3]SCZ41639.1 transcriptional regulator, AsnC family [Pseudomonas sp. NFACC44-2]SDA87915.1 transcriptional regulator, AsnC family [Pseudomonas sp. NFACC51]SDA90363.1 transcriptional regulator, AsnC family [Pseudomonas sp. NFACC15-1]
MKLDAFDRKILAALQRDGRLSNVQLAEEIGLSPSPCLRRVRMLEDAGVIRGYQAILDRDEVGLGLTIFVGVKVERHNDEQAEAFRQAVTALPEVISAFLVSGESDFLLQVVVPDLRAYDRFLTGRLLKLPGVSDIRSNFAIHTVKTPGALPLGHLPGG